MIEGLRGRVVGGIRLFAGRLALSLVTAVCAALIAPRVLPLLGGGQERTPQIAAEPRLAPPAVDLEAVFARQQPTLPGPLESALVEKAAPVQPVAADTASRNLAHQPARSAERRPRAVPVPAPRPSEPQQPLELAAMTLPAPPPQAERPKLFGWALPRVPFEDSITGTISSARNSVARLFN